MAAVLGRRVTVGTSATLVASSGSQGWVKNPAGGAEVDLGGATVTAGAGFGLPGGESVWIESVPEGGLYAASAGGELLVLTSPSQEALAMTIQSWPFYNAGTGGTEVLEEQWSIMARHWSPTGVIGAPGGTELQVAANGSGREVHVAAGRACVRGYWLTSTATETVTIAANTSGSPRIDRVVLRLDPTSDGITLHVIEGTPAGSPTAPALVQTDNDDWDLSLALVTVAAGAVSLESGAVTDDRTFVGLSTSTRRPDGAMPGQRTMDTDTGREWVWDGSAWTAPTPVVAQSQVTGLVNALVPVGGVTQFAGAAAPSGWLLCDGAAVSRSAYAALFAVLGTTYGAGDGSTTFALPDLKGRVPVGLDTGQAEFDALAETGGAKTHTLSVAETPSHNHGGATGVQSANHTHGPGAGSGAANFLSQSAGGSGGTAVGTVGDRATFTATSTESANHTHSIASQGGGGAHNNLQPYLVLNYIIRVA